MAKKIYVPKGVTTSIGADIKMTVKVGENYYSVSGHEERELPKDDVNLEYEWDDLYDELYDRVYMELTEIKKSVRRKR